jgi:hypothetical protein
MKKSLGLLKFCYKKNAVIPAPPPAKRRGPAALQAGKAGIQSCGFPIKAFGNDILSEGFSGLLRISQKVAA